MNKSKIKSKKNCLSKEETTLFLKDFKSACKTMELALFNNLFTKHDLLFIKDFVQNLSNI